MTEYERLIQKLHRIEALFAGAKTKGERAAAQHAMQRILAKARDCEQADPPIEYRFSLSNTWSRQVLIALLRRYQIRPYRYYRQRRTTVMAQVSPMFVKDTLWPEFEAINDALRAHFDQLTDQIIHDAITQETGDIDEVHDPVQVKALPGTHHP